MAVRFPIKLRTSFLLSSEAVLNIGNQNFTYWILKTVIKSAFQVLSHVVRRILFAHSICHKNTHIFITCCVIGDQIWIGFIPEKVVLLKKVLVYLHLYDDTLYVVVYALLAYKAVYILLLYFMRTGFCCSIYFDMTRLCCEIKMLKLHWQKLCDSWHYVQRIQRAAISFTKPWSEVL